MHGNGKDAHDVVGGLSLFVVVGIVVVVAPTASAALVVVVVRSAVYGWQ